MAIKGIGRDGRWPMKENDTRVILRLSLPKGPQRFGVWRSQLFAKKVVAFFPVALLACTPNSREGEPSKANFSYWSNAPGYTCARMSGKDYCVKDEDTRAANFVTDSAPGFLVQMPVSDPELVRCNRQRYLLEAEEETRPSIQLSFGDRFAMQDGKVFDTTELYYERMLKHLTENDRNRNLDYPKSQSNFYGLSCMLYKKDSLNNKEMLCYGGKYGGNNPPFFFSCMRDGSVPYPGCHYDLFLDGLHLQASYSKACAPYHQKIRAKMIEYLRSLRVERKH